jgi:hypothetical protein
MTPCVYEQEGFCILQDEKLNAPKCPKAKGKLQECTAKESDLIELCPECEKPTSECDCGTCWVLVTDDSGHIAILTPKSFEKMKRVTRK